MRVIILVCAMNNNYVNQQFGVLQMELCSSGIKPSMVACMQHMSVHRFTTIV